jgi:uncharacterized HAD superfamily protein
MIAFDIDGVIADSESVLVEGLEDFTGEKFSPLYPRTYDFRDGFDSLSLKHCLFIIDYVLQTKHIPVYDFNDTYLALSKIQHKYGKVHFITSRNSDLWFDTCKWIEYNFGYIKYDLEMIDHDGDKETVMKEKNINVLVEDRLKTVNNLKNGNMAYLINRPWNVDRPIRGHVIRVANVLEAVNHYLGEPDPVYE